MFELGKKKVLENSKGYLVQLIMMAVLLMLGTRGGLLAVVYEA